jgi:hypothetical protein
VRAAAPVAASAADEDAGVMDAAATDAVAAAARLL